MKAIFLSVCLGLLFSVNAQNVSCGHDQVSNLQRVNNKNYEYVFKKINEEVKQYIDNNYGPAQPPPPNTTYMIPVVFHIVHPSGDTYGSGANISYNQILSQMNAINAAFSMDYPTYNGQQHSAYAQNTGIRFCLARTTMPSNVSFYNGPNGTEYGVMRYADNALTNHQITNASANALLGLTHPSASYFPYANYLNIWIVNNIGSGPGTIMGYAPTPLMGGYPIDGVVMRSDIIGDNSTGNNFNLGYNLQQGKVLTHEIGHYLNLYHIFQGGCAGANAPGSLNDACDLNGDFICDIEPCNTQNYNCNLPIPNTCVANYPSGTTTMDMIEDYMSYADDDCMNTFTSDQSQRMWATLNAMRFNLWQNTNLSATGIIGNGGCLSAFLMDQIVKSTNNICSGVPLQLSNPTGGNSAISWTWTTTGGVPASGSGSSIAVTYPTPGTYLAILAVTDGTVTAYDTLAIPVSNCALDSSKIDRSHWYFGNYAELNFSTIPVSPGNSAFNYTTMYQGFESTISMSDRYGNLLFYTNSTNLWNRNHQQVNQMPIFANQGGSSTPGLLAVPFPQDSSRFILISSPHSGQDYDSIYYAIYDTLAQTITQKRGFRHASLPNQFSEPLTVVPHCNGSDYWIICRPFYNLPVANNAYAMLLTAAGPQNIDTVIVSQNIWSATSGQLKSNKAGDRLIQGNFNGGPAVYFYNFSRSTGQISGQTPNLSSASGAGTGAIFSPNGTVAYASRFNNNQPTTLYKIDVATMATQTMVTPPGFQALQMELGPDNNIYLSQSNYLNTTMGRIINADNFATAQFVPAVINFPNGINPFGGMCNFMDADRGPELDPDFTITGLNCNSYQMNVNSCWQVYKATWLFGDGSGGLGLSVNHTYAGPGVYPVQLILSVGNYSLPPVVKYITILPQSLTITGPTVLCIGSPYPNSYGTTSVSGATYSWSVINGGVMGPDFLPFVDVTSASGGVMTVSVQVNNNGCFSSGTRTVLVDNIPAINFTSPNQLCAGATTTLAATPSGGVFSGNNVTGNTFSASATGTYTVFYSASNANGCANTAERTITVSPAPQVNFAAPPHQLCVNVPLTLSATPQGGTFSGTGVTGNTFVSQAAGTYTATYSVTVNGCSGIATRVIYVVNCTGTGLAEQNGGARVRIYPNPSDAKFIISYDEEKEAVVEIVNAIGQVILVQKLSGETTVDLSGYADGMYVGRINGKKGGVTFKIVKQN